MLIRGRMALDKFKNKRLIANKMEGDKTDWRELSSLSGFE
jgi:hypothetical protein